MMTKRLITKVMSAGDWVSDDRFQSIPVPVVTRELTSETRITMSRGVSLSVSGKKN